MGILEAIDQLVGTFVPPLQDMGTLLSTMVNMTNPIDGSPAVMPLSTAAVLGFVMPWVDNLGAICTGLANFMIAL